MPFFFAAVLFALYNQAPTAHVASLMACWLGVRLGYLAMYLANWGALRSLVWAISVGFVIAILFSGV
ncbi:MAPEG family protein [compost metagenome]